MAIPLRQHRWPFDLPRHRGAVVRGATHASCSIELSDEALGCDQSEGVFDDGGNLVPIHFVASSGVEVHTEPVGERSLCRRRRLEAAFGFGANELVLNAMWRS